MLGSYMTARIRKNGGFSEEAKVNLVKAISGEIPDCQYKG